MNKIVKTVVSLLVASITFCMAGCNLTMGGNSESSSSTPNNSSIDDSAFSSEFSEESSESQENSEESATSEETSLEDSETSSDEPPMTPIFPEPAPEQAEGNPMPVTVNNMINTLKNTPYRSPISNADYGLKDPSKIGADVRAFSRVLYPAPIGGVKTYAAKDYGITLNGKNNTDKLNALLKDLKGVEGIKKIAFESGTYTFNGSIILDGIEDLYLVGENTLFTYSTWCTAFEVTSCKNIHFNGISIDYNPSPVVAGSVVGCNTSTKSITIQLDNEFSLNNSLYKGGAISYGSYMEFKTDANGNLYPNASGNLLYNSTGDNVKNITGGTYNATSNQLTLTFTSIKSVSAGTRVSVAFTMYEYPGYIVKSSENFYMEGCNIYCTPGMGILLQSVKNTYLNRMNIMLKAGSSRLMTVTADGVHSKDCLGDLKITGGVYENSHDDSMNIASFYKEITAVSRREKVISCKSSALNTDYPIEAGDVIEVYNPATLELLQTYTVKSVKKSALLYKVTVDKVVSDDLIGMIVGNATRSPKVKINDCIFRNKRNRGILLQARNCDISGNTFQNIVHGPISVHSVLDIFAEAIIPGKVTITNNKFINNNEGHGLSGDIALFARGNDNKGVSGAIKDVTVSNNFFYESARAGVFYSCAGNGTIAYNMLCKTGVVSKEKYAIYVSTSTNITIKGNCAVRTQNESGFVIYNSQDATIIDNSDYNTKQIIGGI